MNADEQLLFKHTPKAAKLLKQGKAMEREQTRRLWWRNNQTQVKGQTNERAKN